MEKQRRIWLDTNAAKCSSVRTNREKHPQPPFPPSVLATGVSNPARQGPGKEEAWEQDLSLGQVSSPQFSRRVGPDKCLLWGKEIRARSQFYLPANRSKVNHGLDGAPS